jgi:enoyl-CoA hydratase/carnithine racemase
MQVLDPDAGQPLRLQRESGCWTLTLQRTAKANALTAAMMEALADAADEAGRQPLPPVLLLRSASARAFCAGADIAEFAAGAPALQRQEHALLRLIGALARTPAPLLMEARGRAAGAGAILLALGDVVIAGDDLVLAAPEMAFGMYPVIVEAVLASRLPPALAMQLCLSGRALAADEALALGLATERLPARGFEQAAAARREHYLARATALRTARAARLAGPDGEPMLERLQRVAPLMGRNYADPAVRERIARYLDDLRHRRE